MERIFPFKNRTFNSLIDLTEGQFLNHYFWEHLQQKSPAYKDTIDREIQHFRDNLPDFENELLQIINTTNQETIDYYFDELKGNIDYIKELDKGELLNIINEYNTKISSAYIEKVEKDIEEYFKKEERTKYKHLEKYERTQFAFGYPFLSSKREHEKVQVTNYNFYCIESIPELVDLSYFDQYTSLFETLVNELLTISDKYIDQYNKGEIKANIEKFFNKTIVYVEGELDIKYILTAAKHLEVEHILEKVELRQRNGFRNLDKIWDFYNNNSLELIAQRKILLYDCDTLKKDDSFGNFLFKRVIPTMTGHIISKGIENLFSTITVQKAINVKKEFVDFTSKKGTVRGVEFYEESNEVNKDEKTNFCDWICAEGTKEDFKNFIVIFNIIDDIENNIR